MHIFKSMLSSNALVVSIIHSNSRGRASFRLVTFLMPVRRSVLFLIISVRSYTAD